MKLVLNTPELSFAKTADGYTVTLSEGGHSIQFTLSETAFVNMGLDCISVCPAIESELILEGTNAAVRHLGRGLMQLSDLDIQALVRASQSDALVKMLWFMRDADLMALVARNMSQQAADTILDELQTHANSYRDPDASDVNRRALREGRDATVEMVDLAARLGDEGKTVWGTLQ